tara:strand:+ start:5752 stop:6036 length:285 start_codon:yes stop_codon:yes gene_type:complete
MANLTLLALATKNLKKSDDQKAIDALTDQVEANENAFQNSLFAAKTAVKTSKKRVAALESDASASADSIISAGRELLVAEKNVEEISAIIARRF